MVDLKERFQTLDTAPAPDLEKIIQLRARHLATVPGALGPADADELAGRRFRFRPSQLLAAAAILALGIGLAVLLRYARTAEPARHRPSPPPSTSLSRACPEAQICPLAAGTFSLNRLESNLTFTVPDGWSALFAAGPGEDLHLYYRGSFLIWVGLRPVAGSYECPAEILNPSNPGNRLQTPRQLADWMVRHPRLRTTGPHSAVLGHITGVQLDAVIAPGVTASCSLVAIPDWSYPMHQWGVGNQEKTRIYFLEIPGTQERPASTVVIAIKASIADFDRIIRQAAPILESFSFDV